MTISLEDIRRVLDSHKVPYQEPEGDMIIFRGTADFIEPFSSTAWDYYIRATDLKDSQCYTFRTLDQLHELLDAHYISQPYDEHSATPLPPL